MKYALVLAAGLLAVPSVAWPCSADTKNCTPDGGTEPVPTNAVPVIECRNLKSALLEIDGRDAGEIAFDGTVHGKVLSLPSLPASSTVAITTFAPYEHRFVMRVGAGPDMIPPPAPMAPVLTQITRGVPNPNSCQSQQANWITWEVPGLGPDIVAVEITEGGQFLRVRTVPLRLTLIHIDGPARRCFRAIAIDSAGLRSAESNETCIDVTDVIPPTVDAGVGVPPGDSSGGCRCVPSPSRVPSVLLFIFGLLFCRSRDRRGV